MSIKNLVENINRGAIFHTLVLVLVAGLAFGLGRLTRLEEARELVRVERPAAVAEAERVVAPTPTPAPTNALTAQTNQVVASRTGEKYHWPWCAGAKRIKPENKIYFDSPQAAREAGLTPAANCQGLP